MLNREPGKYQFYSPWFYTTGTRHVVTDIFFFYIKHHLYSTKELNLLPEVGKNHVSMVTMVTKRYLHTKQI